MKYGIITISILILLSGCDQPTVKEKDKNTAHVVEQTYLPPPPRKKIKLKDINDTNFNADYMYPKESKTKESVEAAIQTPIAHEESMDKAECIAMITQEKFDKYAEMFGSEEASIKRCKMLKAVR